MNKMGRFDTNGIDENFVPLRSGTINRGRASLTHVLLGAESGTVAYLEYYDQLSKVIAEGGRTRRPANAAENYQGGNR